MAEGPVVNPIVDDIADQAKYRYATGTKLLAAMQYRLAELAGTGRLDPDESMSLQHDLVSVWEALYFGTVCAVRDWDTDDCTWDEADNTYSDGRQVMVQIRIEPGDSPDFSWKHNGVLLGDGAVNEHPLGTICDIAPINPDDDQVVSDPPQLELPTDLETLQAAIDLGDGAYTAKSDGDDEIQ
jgi:hypothetical protein